MFTNESSFKINYSCIKKLLSFTHETSNLWFCNMRSSFRHSNDIWQALAKYSEKKNFWKTIKFVQGCSHLNNRYGSKRLALVQKKCKYRCSKIAYFRNTFYFLFQLKLCLSVLELNLKPFEHNTSLFSVSHDNNSSQNESSKNLKKSNNRLFQWKRLPTLIYWKKHKK